MKAFLAGCSVALAVAGSATLGWASSPADMSGPGGWAETGTIIQQRKDVDEVSRPQPPSGPASVYCSPGAPICP